MQDQYGAGVDDYLLEFYEKDTTPIGSPSCS